MKRNEELTHKRLFRTVLPLFLSAVLLLACIFTLIAVSFGWYYYGTDVKARGIGVRVVKTSNLDAFFGEWDGTIWAGEWASFDTAATVTLNNISLPGDKQYLRLRFVNVGDEPVTISGFGLFAPSAEEETAIVHEGNDYWLSTELRITLCGVSLFNAVNQEQIIMTGGEDAHFISQKTENGVVRNELDLLTDAGGSLIIPEDGSGVFDILLEFFNDTENSQNVYKDFGVAGELCIRRFFVRTEE